MKLYKTVKAKIDPNGLIKETGRVIKTTIRKPRFIRAWVLVAISCLQLSAMLKEEVPLKKNTESIVDYG